MVDNILTPSTGETPTEVLSEQSYFLIDNYLSELETDAQKGIARENLGIYGKTDLYTQVEVDNKINKAVGDAVKSLLASDDPHQILPKVNQLLKDYTRKDGTTPFTAPQVGVDPLLDSHLTTKKFVQLLLDNHIKQTDPHNVMDLVNETLKQYSLAKNVYNKSEVYTKEQVDKITKPYVKSDGTVPFVAPQSGVTPITDQHLTTKRYVDNAIFKHEVSVDPHGLLTILNQRLNNYYKTTETYSKAETYSRAQIDQVINTLVTDAAYQAIKEHTRQFDPHNILKEVYKEHYVRRDGSVPFTSVQKGIEGTEDNDLATVGQLKQLKKELSKDDSDKLVWVTAGPILTTVGFMEDNTEVPPTMSLQEIMDSIFYGKVLEVTAPETAMIGSSLPITMSIRGNAMIEKAELYQNEKLIGTYDRDDFLDWDFIVTSEPVLINTTFTFVVTYINGQTASTTCTTNVSYGVFIGVVPKTCMPGDLRYNDMLALVENKYAKMYAFDEDVTTIVHKFNFKDGPKKLTLALPENYNQLDYMYTASQHFDIDAFNIETVPVVVPGVEEPVLFTYYMYKESLTAFNSEVTFKLSNHE